MNRSLSFSLRIHSLRARSLTARNCRDPLMPSRVRRDALAEKLDKQWRELRRHATIERDPETLLRLTAELDKRNRQAAVIDRRTAK